MASFFSTTGIFKFNIPNVTKKHKTSSVWKTIALIKLDDDIEAYYRWFLKKRFRLQLSPTLRGSHITFINDRTSDLDASLFKKVAQDLHNTKIDITLGCDPRTSGEHWWLNIPEEFRKEFHDIRKSVGLGRPYFGLHMTIGYANKKNNLIHSNYIHTLLIR